MIFLKLVLAQVIQTVPSTIIGHDRQLYKPSPTYAIKPVTKSERFALSDDGTRVAFITQFPSDAPGAVGRRIAKGSLDLVRNRIGVWSRETGRAADVYVATSAGLAVDALQFVGHDLIFSTNDTSNGKASNLVWYSQNGKKAKRINLSAFEGGAHFWVSPSLTEVLVADGHHLWVATSRGARPLTVPGYRALNVLQKNSVGQVVISGVPISGQAENLLYDFATRRIFKDEAREATDALRVLHVPPFLAESYIRSGYSRGGVDDFKDDEEIGYRLYLKPDLEVWSPRLFFAQGMNASYQVSNDGLTYAFVSNGILMVRWLIRLESKTEKGLAGEY